MLCGEWGEVVVRWHPVRAGERVFCEPRCKWRFHSRLWRVRHTGAQHNGADLEERPAGRVMWIESHQALGQHPKTHQLATLLRVSLPTVIGHLHYFWWWALDFAPTGVIPNATPQVIARAAQWTSNPDKFWLAMVQAGWIDVNEEVVSVHDWLDYAGRLVEKRAANAERMRNARAKHVHCTCGARAGATVPDRTGPEYAAAAAAVPEIQPRRDTRNSGPPPRASNSAFVKEEHAAGLHRGGSFVWCPDCSSSSSKNSFFENESSAAC